MARQIHQLSAYCHLLIVTAQLRQAYDDGEPLPHVKEAKFYDRVWQTLDLVAYLSKLNGQGAPKAIFAPPYGKARLPAMPESLAPFSWDQVFQYAVGDLDLPTPEERRRSIDKSLERFSEMVKEPWQLDDGSASTSSETTDGAECRKSSGLRTRLPSDS